MTNTETVYPTNFPTTQVDNSREMTLNSQTNRSQKSQAPKQVPTPEGAPKHAKGLSWLFLIIAIVGIVHISYIFFWEYRQFKDRTMMLGKLEQSMYALRAESNLLVDTLDHKLDLNYREQLARTEGFVYQDERLIASPKR